MLISTRVIGLGSRKETRQGARSPSLSVSLFSFSLCCVLHALAKLNNSTFPENNRRNEKKQADIFCLGPTIAKGSREMEDKHKAEDEKPRLSYRMDGTRRIFPLLSSLVYLFGRRIDRHSCRAPKGLLKQGISTNTDSTMIDLAYKGPGWMQKRRPSFSNLDTFSSK